MDGDERWHYREGGYEVRPVDSTTVEDFGRFTDLMESAWRDGGQPLGDRNLVPPHVFEGQSKQGNTLGTFADDEFVAFAHFMPPIEGPGEEGWVYSHAVGVAPEHRNAGVGRTQKRGQAAYLADLGYRGMHWTFDPNRSLNARLNYHVLGCTTTEFVPNKYPELPGLPADRLVARMDFGTGRFEQVMAAGAIDDEYPDLRRAFVLEADCSVDFAASAVTPAGDDAYEVEGVPPDAPLAVDNPRAFDDLPDDRQREVHFARRALFARLLSTPESSGTYAVVDYLKDDESPGDHPAYVLVPSASRG